MPFELPVRVTEAKAMLVGFAARTSALQRLTPEHLKVVELAPGFAPIGLSCFEYLQTTIGAYNEVGIAWPVVLSDKTSWRNLPLLPMLFENHWPGAGWWVHWLPVTTRTALEAGRDVWGYPKFLADIDFGDYEGRRTCSLAEGGREILRLTASTRMPALPRTLETRTFTEKDGSLLSTRISVKAHGFQNPLASCDLTLGDHDIGRELSRMGIVPRALDVRWFPQWTATLPAGEPAAHRG